MSSIAWTPFVELVRRSERFLLTSHIRPDCDALGSELGMAGILTALGKQVTIANGHRTPPNLAFIDPEHRIRTLGEDVSVDALVQGFDVLMVLDTSAWAQLGPMGDVIRGTTARKIVVDHHVSEDDLGAVPFKDTTAEATGCLVAEAAEQLGVPLTPAMATPLFAAVATDTGWFRFRSARSSTYRTAARLIDAGADPAAIYNHLYEQDTLGRMRLRGVILERIISELDGRLGHTFVRLADFQHTQSLPSDTEDIINLVLAVRGIEVAVILVELSSGGFKVSFRSRCALDCSQVAERFGGGGHKAAAGATVMGSFEDVRAKVLDTVRQFMPAK